MTEQAQNIATLAVETADVVAAESGAAEAEPKRRTRKSASEPGTTTAKRVRKIPAPEGYSPQNRRQTPSGAEALKDAIEKQEILSVRVTHATADEIFVLIDSNGIGGHLLGAMPKEEFDEKIYAGYEGWVGENVHVVITGYDAARGVALVSRKKARQIELKQLLDSGFGVGSVVTGVVRSIQPYAAFVEVGGLHCILPVNEISYGYVNHPGDVLRRGDIVDVKVISWQPETLKARVSMKAMTDPWAKVNALYSKNTIVFGAISGARDGQVWVRPEPYNGVEILCPAMPNRRYDIGQKVRVRLLTVQPEQHKLRGKIIGTVR